MSLLSEPSYSVQTTRQMAILRLMTVCLGWGFLPLVISLFHLPSPGIQLHAVFLSYLLFSLISLMRTAGPRSISLSEWLVYWLIDYLFVGTLILVTGGIRNPMTAYFFVLLALTAFAFPKKWSWAFWLLALVEYSFIAVMTFEQGSIAHHGATEYHVHLMGMWLSFGLTSWLLCYFLTKVLTTLRKNNLEMASIQERVLRDDLAVMMGTLAATTAHTIATPLSSMSVILADLKKDGLAVELKQEIELLQSQVQHCKSAIQQMADRAKDYQLNGEANISVIVFAKILQEDFQLLKPKTMPSMQLHESIENENPYIKTNPTLSKSILHFIDNALLAGSNSVKMKLRCDEHWVNISIQDDGQGISAEALMQWGSAFNTQRQGLGVGVFLSHVTIERLGGSIRVNQNIKQTEIDIFLPRVK